MGLKETLAGALFVSETTGRLREIRLQRGLVIAVRVTAAVTALRIERANSVPSRTEWNTVLAAWPYPCEGVEPCAVVENGRTVLQATWPTPPRLLADA
jgi:hypothetical protein